MGRTLFLLHVTAATWPVTSKPGDTRAPTPAAGLAGELASMDMSTPPPCAGWTAARVAGAALEIAHRDLAVNLAKAVSTVPVGTAINMGSLATQMGDDWEAGAETIVEYLTMNGLATMQGEADTETLTLLVAPDPVHV